MSELCVIYGKDVIKLDYQKKSHEYIGDKSRDLFVINLKKLRFLLYMSRL